jgi:hypothetical protein
LEAEVSIAEKNGYYGTIVVTRQSDIDNVYLGIADCNSISNATEGPRRVGPEDI